MQWCNSPVFIVKILCRQITETNIFEGGKEIFPEYH